MTPDEIRAAAREAVQAMPKPTYTEQDKAELRRILLGSKTAAVRDGASARVGGLHGQRRNTTSKSA